MTCSTPGHAANGLRKIKGFTLAGVLPPGVAAVDATVTVAVLAFLRRLQHHHSPQFVAIQAPKPPAVMADLRGIPFLLF